jgi:diadenosine tetraphosphatase ApaH/serine/threonine PP2A family protein phosphatase
MIAVISDIHANYEALSRVLDEIEELGADQIICLGDVVGYGPEPEQCIDAVRANCDVVLCGNHDFAVVYGADDFRASAAQAINYHRERLMPRMDQTAEDDVRRQRWDFLKGLPFRYTTSGYLFVHGSPRNPRHEYLRERDIRWRLDDKMEQSFALFRKMCFVGHTHRPGVFTDEFEYYSPQELDGVYRPEEGVKSIVNVGSVGQPRDGDPKSSFATVEEDDTVRWHRVSYDLEATVKKMERVGTYILDGAERLRTGE